ncbi:MAG: hypothetical protein IJY08_02840 [Clostridia bacterium]|nr:hypothetical protein [Clostridia bacterium]
MKFAKVIRVMTVAPVMAMATLCTLFIVNPSLFGKWYLFAIAMLFLGVLPLLAYPLQPFIPKFKDKGREGQRTLAMLFAVSGYILGCLTNLFLGAPVALWIIYLDYLISGALILVFNKLFHLRASAHACGVAGPTALIMYLGVPAALIPGIVLYFSALWASLKMKRHTWQQFIGGAAISLSVLGGLHLIF